MNHTEAIIAVKRRVPVPYVLYHAQSGTYQLVDKGRVIVFQCDTVARVHEYIDERIRCLASFMEATGYIIRVYEVRYPATFKPNC